MRKGRYAEAAECFTSAVQQSPDVAEYYARWAEALGNFNRFDEMARCCTAGLERCGDDAQLWSHLGVAMLNLERPGDAAVCFGRLTKLLPEHFKGYYLLALALIKSRDPKRAMTCLELACSKDDRQPEVWMALGELCLSARLWDRGLDCFKRVLKLRPDSVPALNNTSVILRLQEKPQEAEPYLRAALRLQPDCEEPLRNLATVLDQMGRRREALELYDRFFELYPNSTLALSGAYWLCARMCAWDRLEQYEERLLRAVDAGSGEIEPFALLRTSATRKQQLACARRFEGTRPTPGIETFAPRNASERRRLKIGYFSADFQEHAISYLIARMMELHDRGRFEIFGYSCGKYNGGDMRRRIAQACERFVDVSEMSGPEIPRALYADNLDIIVDLTGHTRNSRSVLLASRPAPIQVAYLGYPGTMGVPYIDYVIADPYVIPPGAEEDFSEKVICLPHAYQINDRLRAFSEDRPARSEYGLPKTGTILCSFNLTYKITPQVFAVWMELLREAPDAVLWVLEHDADTIANLKREAESRGVSGDRLVFAPRLPMEQHLRRLRIADLMLDTFPVNAHTSTSDALWSGCPVLTRSGESFVSRVAGSLLRAAGVPQLITNSHEEYRARAVHLVSHPEELRRLRGALEANRLTCPLFDSEQTTRQIENAYEMMWDIHREGCGPRSFSIRAGHSLS